MSEGDQEKEYVDQKSLARGFAAAAKKRFPTSPELQLLTTPQHIHFGSLELQDEQQGILECYGKRC